MHPIPFLLLGLLASTSQDSSNKSAAQEEREAADPKHIQELIRDLGGEPSVREHARRALRQIGQPAIPALQKAASDPDAERALSARSILLDLMAKEGTIPKGQAEVRLFYHDWSRGIDLKRDENGSLTLTVPREGPEGKREFKTYRADSLEDFKKQYPDIAKEYDIDKLASPAEVSKDMHQEWKRLKDRLGIDSSESRPPFESGESGDLERWFERKEKDLRKRLEDWNEEESSAPEGPTFGVTVGPIGAPLQAQLKLPEQSGLLVYGVRPGSLAEKSGVRQYDILTTLNGQPVNVSSIKEKLKKALSSDHFSLDIVRSGSKQALEVRPSSTQKTKP